MSINLRSFIDSFVGRLGWKTLMCMAPMGAATFLVATAPIASAQSFVKTDPDLYRCAVLGEASSCRQQPSRPCVRTQTWVELGTQAKYFRYLGASPSEAIARARALGEDPLRHTDLVTLNRLTAADAYARATSQRIVPDEIRKTVSVTRAHDAHPNCTTTGSG